MSATATTASAMCGQSTQRWSMVLPRTARKSAGRPASEEGDARAPDSAAAQMRGEHHQAQAEHQVQQHVGHVEDAGVGERSDISAVDEQDDESDAASRFVMVVNAP